MIMRRESLSDDMQENITQKITSQFIWLLDWVSKEAPVDSL
jgi:hypothetical protein